MDDLLSHRTWPSLQACQVLYIIPRVDSTIRQLHNLQISIEQHLNQYVTIYYSFVTPPGAPSYHLLYASINLLATSFSLVGLTSGKLEYLGNRKVTNILSS
jgi:hypothetical protein